MKLRAGDLVKATATVREDYDSSVESHVRLESRGTHFEVRSETVELVEEKFCVGDTVDVKRGSGSTYVTGSVAALHEGWAWVKAGSSMWSLPVKDLERVEEPPPSNIPDFGWLRPVVGETGDGVAIGEPRLYGEVPPCETSPQEITYTTATGDTLEAVAHVFGTSVDTIRVLNADLVSAIPASLPLTAGVPLLVNDNRIPF